MTEKEAIFVQHFDKSPPAQETVKVVTSFVALNDLKHGTAPGIVSSIKESFGGVGITEETLQTKLVGFGSDGATVNRGQKDGVIAHLQGAIPWTVCGVSHTDWNFLLRMRLGNLLDDVDDPSNVRK